MKSPRLNFLLAAVLPLFVSWNALASDYYREITRQFKVNDNVNLGLNTSFANITVNTWDENEMFILVKMNVDVKSESRAEQVFNSVKITESSSAPQLRIDPTGKWKGNESYSIEVEIKMPRSAQLSGEVSFGNMTISTLKGKYSVSLDYGNLTAAELKSSVNDVSVDFGNVYISGFGGGSVEVEYGNVKLESVSGNTEIDEGFGNVKIQKILSGCTTLDVDCEYGNIEIDIHDGATITASSSYGEIEFKGQHKVNDSKSDYFNRSVSAEMGSGKCQIYAKVSFGNVEFRLKK